MRIRATARIIERARRSPGGVIRWREAAEEYQKVSPSASRRHKDDHVWHVGLSRALKRHFIRVEGITGYYVLREFLDPPEDGMADDAKKDRRVRLVRTDDPWTRLRPGDEGTVKFEDDTGTLFVDWDSGERLGLVPGHDMWVEIG